MKPYAIFLFFIIILNAPVFSEAANVVDFQVLKTSDLLDLCTTSPADDLYQEAIHFCHGYLIGAFHYYVASTIGPGGEQEICFPVPKPTRNEAVSMFVNWVKDNPQYHNELPVETEFRFLHETWPCVK
jgi:hypothetical protein